MGCCANCCANGPHVHCSTDLEYRGNMSVVSRTKVYPVVFAMGGFPEPLSNTTGSVQAAPGGEWRRNELHATGFLPRIHSETNINASQHKGRRTRRSPESQYDPSTPSDPSSGQDGYDNRSSRRGSRWWRGPLCRLLTRARSRISSWRSCGLILLLVICVLIQVFIFFQVSRNAHAYLASTPVLKGRGAASHASTGMPVDWKLDMETVRVLTEEYDARGKKLPFVGAPDYMAQLRPRSRGWYNSNAVFPGSSSESMHGKLGINPDGIPLWVPKDMPEAIDAQSVNKTEELKSGGGFYLRLSDALPLDRHPPDSRDPACLNVQYNLQELSDHLDTTIVITYYNEPMSTLLRSLHSVLNFTPPPLVREILLVDDSSNNTALLPGDELDEYIPYLPKVKLIRMEERSGIVPARMRGIRAAKAPVVVILDSHIEVNDGWLEPQLARIHESPKSFVFPQTLSIVATDFTHSKDAGIGCFVSFDWNVQEKSHVAGFWGDTNAIPSPMHGGGLLAFRKDTFFDMGGYDEGFTMWGAENVELSFRIWMCGAKLECAPCASVYHVFRSGGTGYQLPPGSVWKNRMRTAKIWMGEYFPLTAAFNSYHLSHPEPELSDMTQMIELKERLKCKDMNWFMKHVDPKHEFQDLSTALAGLGEIRSVHKSTLCLDSLGETDVGNNIGFYQCHGQLGNQGFLLINESKQLRLMGMGKTSRSRLCVTPPGILDKCTNEKQVGHVHFDSEAGTISWTGPGQYQNHCLGIENEAVDKGKLVLTWKPCSAGDERQQWTWQKFPSDTYLPRQMRGGYKEHMFLETWREKATELRSKKEHNFCLDSLQQRQAGSSVSVFWCHGGLGTQGFTFIEEKGLLLAHARASDGSSLLCVGPPKTLYSCSDNSKAAGISITPEGQVKWSPTPPDSAEELCLTVVMSPDTPISKGLQCVKLREVGRLYLGLDVLLGKPTTYGYCNAALRLTTDLGRRESKLNTEEGVHGITTKL